MKLTFVIILGVVVLILIGGGVWLYTPDKPRAVLEAKYGVGPDDFLTVADIRLHIKDTGPKDAPVIVLLHGFGSSLQTWEPWATQLSLDHRVIRYGPSRLCADGARPHGGLLGRPQHGRARGVDE